MELNCIFIGILFYLIFNKVNGQDFTVSPLNSHVMKGQSVTLECTVKDAGTGSAKQNWREFYTNPNAGKVVTDDSTVLPDYTSEFVIQGTFNLQLLNAQSKHGWKYSCESVYQAGPPTVYAEIIVLESNPVCSSSVPSNIVMENDLITYSCEMTYSGKWAPVMEWKDKNGGIILSNNQSTINFVKYSIDITATEADNGQQYNCNTKFPDTLVPPPGTGAATNVPSYTNDYNSDVLTVHYSPRRTKIQDTNGQDITDGKELNPGEVIKCVSESNPAVNVYEWRNSTDNSLLGKSQEITVTESWLGDADISCVVKNIMGPLNDTVGVDNVTIAVTIMTTTTTTTASTTTTTTSTTAITTLTIQPAQNSTVGGECTHTTAAIVGGVLGSLLTVVCILFGGFVLRVFHPRCASKESTAEEKATVQPNIVTYENVDVLHEKTQYADLDVNTREEDVNPYRNDYMELRVS